MVYGKGNRRAQQRRRRNNNKEIPILDEEYLLIDGNYSQKPYKYCCKYKGFLTKNQMLLHKCEKRKCTNLKDFDWAIRKGKDKHE